MTSKPFYILLMYSCQSRGLCSNIILVLAHIRSTSPRVGDWDTRWVFTATLQLVLLGLSWPMIEVCAQLRSAIQSRMTFLDLSEANFDKLQRIMHVSFQPRHVSKATISLWTTCKPVHSALFIFICFILIMLSSALNEWMRCAQIVIYQDTSHLSAGGSSRSASAMISIAASSVCEGCHQNALNC